MNIQTLVNTCWLAARAWCGFAPPPVPPHEFLLQRSLLARWWNRIELAILCAELTPAEQREARGIGYAQLLLADAGAVEPAEALQTALDQISALRRTQTTRAIQ